MRKMPITDAFFLINESRRTPMHVGGVNLFTLPRGVNDTTFLQQLGDILRYDGELRRPFGEKLKMGPLGPLGSVYWEPDEMLDMDYHIRHSALPGPGRYRELFALVSRLHSTLLDRSRPLWEMHLIEGLENRQFATYFKVHHAAIDGVGAMHLTNSMLSNSPRTRIGYSPFSAEAYQVYKERLAAARPKRVRPRADEVKAVSELLREQLGGTVNVAGALRRYAQVWLGGNSKLAVPWHQVPRTSLTTQVTGARRFVAQSWPFARVRAVGKALDATLNDTVLAMCAGALRRHLLEQGDLPKHSLKAMAPVSLRVEGDVDSANAVGFLTADLATQLSDPVQRLRAIKDSMDAGKAQLSGMSQREVEIYTVITQAPMLLSTLTGLASKLPAFSTVVSNVPGPREPMYWNGARLDGLYPVSIPFDGFALNITLVSNHDSLDFGIVACRRSVPHVQRLIDYMEEALVELEEAAGLATGAAKTKSGSRAKSGARAKTGARAKAGARKKTGTSTKAGAKARAKTKTVARTKTAAKAKAGTGARARSKSKAGPRAKARPKSATRASTNPERGG